MKLCFFTIKKEGTVTYPTDRLENSIKKYYLDTPFFVCTEKEIKESGSFLFPISSYSYILTKDFDIVIKIKHNFELLNKIDDLIEGDYSAVVTKNLSSIQKGVWNINPMAYLTSDFIIIKSKDFSQQWLDMCCMDNSKKYINNEEDKLNILTYYGDMTVRILDKKDLEGKIKI